MKQRISYLGVVFTKMKLKASAKLPDENYKNMRRSFYLPMVCYSFMYEYDILQGIIVVLASFTMKQIQYN